MQWTDLLGHKTQLKWFRTALHQNRLASTFLMVGPNGIGKRTFARLVAKSLLCPNAIDFSPCGSCESCAQVDASTHPDLIQMAKPSDKSTIPIEALVGDRENRLREGLCYEISLKPFSGMRRIAIIDDADYLAVEGANSLLKTLEEPPPGAVIFLISSSEQRQLPTIRSRCQVVRFQPLSTEDMTQLLLRLGWASDEALAREFASLSEGSLGNVRFLQDADFRAYRNELRLRLTEAPMKFQELAKSIIANIDSVGSDGAEKRERLRVIIKEVTLFYRQLLLDDLQVVATVAEGGVPLDAAARQMVRRLPNARHTALRGIQRCLEASNQVERFMGAPIIVESLCTDLAEINQA